MSNRPGCLGTRVVSVCRVLPATLFRGTLGLYLCLLTISLCATASVCSAHLPQDTGSPAYGTRTGELRNDTSASQNRGEPASHKTVVDHASWYGPGFNGHKTATGERFSEYKMTAAARNLPLGSRVKVTNLRNGRTATVKVNDCGPFRDGRKIDLSKRAAEQLGMVHKGTAVVKARVVSKPPGASDCHS
jgi:rare lipoprotein A (peptidoglycan hydrolase)